MLLFALVFFAAAVLTMLFCAAVVATATAILAVLLLILQAGWWIITRPIVWFIIRPVEYLCGIKTSPPNEVTSVAKVRAKTLPSIPLPVATSAMTEKVEQLQKLKSLLEDGAINQDEFEGMKTEVLAN